MSDDPKPLLVALPIRIKTYDIDWVGHVNNIVYVRWLEDLRLHLLDVHFPLEALRSEGVAPIIVTTNIHYRQGIALSDHEVDASMWISKIGLAAFHLSAEFRVGEDLRCTATQRGTFVDHAKMKPMRVPDALVEAFAAQGGAT